MGKTKIEWTDATWNPVTGCTKISEGCRNCYAERMAKRLAGRFGYPADEPFRVTLHPDRLEEPLRWRKPRRVFVCSMGDLFHEDVPLEFVMQVFSVIASTERHVFQVLTKRPRRMQEFARKYQLILPNWKNLWLGVTAENQQAADERIPILLQIPAAVRFVSCEPLLGPIDLTAYLQRCLFCKTPHNTAESFRCTSCDMSAFENLLQQVIVGGESGPGARPMHPDWARSIQDQCRVARVPYFFKQHGEWLYESQFTNNKQRSAGLSCKRCEARDGFQFVRVGKKIAGRLLDGHEYNEMPAQVQS